MAGTGRNALEGRRAVAGRVGAWLLSWRCAVAVCGVLAIAMWGCTRQEVMELQLAGGINALRTERHLEPLPVDPVLSDVARMRAEDMAAKAYFSHDPPDGCDYVCTLGRQGLRYSWVGEIIAWNTYPAADTAGVSVETWESSSAHYGIILGCHFTRMGVGAATAVDGQMYHVAVFEGDAPGCTP